MAIVYEKPARAAIPARREPDMPDWGAAGWAGIGAGLVFLGIELIGSALTGAPWMPSRLIAAIVLGEGILSAPAEEVAVINAAAFAVHMTLSLFFARLLALVFYRQKMYFALEEGVVFGALLYAVNFYLLAILFPFVATGRGMTTFLSHVAFGACVPIFYRRITGYGTGGRGPRGL